MKLTEIELLALLENFRIIHQNDDYIIRSLSADIALAFGYKSRADWTEKVRESGLVEYGTVHDNPETAKENYAAIMDIVRV